jgi:L-threonylcarbamoyladenylate synthase
VPDAAAPRASGTLEAHYAPRTPVALVDAAQLPSTVQRLHAAGHVVAMISHASEVSQDVAAQFRLPMAPDGYAHGLYAALRAMDAKHAAIILVETPPTDHGWQGINDRLRRAAHDSRGALSHLLAK